MPSAPVLGKSHPIANGEREKETEAQQVHLHPEDGVRVLQRGRRHQRGHAGQDQYAERAEHPRPRVAGHDGHRLMR